ncbi:hypothetical protein CUJ83_00465 [Methanocella sp. CWC-04]|uniref:Uncharacterized protein n=2 Tax=Methanooceanicella nereidis TaxID=2052831 RepID=A0AAP2RAB3_9EURY|nr:hypothetical protein [Methanocella sp. CWC-04]
MSSDLLQKVLGELSSSGLICNISDSYELTDRGTKLAICLLGTYGKLCGDSAEQKRLIAALNGRLANHISA